MNEKRGIQIQKIGNKVWNLIIFFCRIALNRTGLILPSNMFLCDGEFLFLKCAEKVLADLFKVTETKWTRSVWLFSIVKSFKKYKSTANKERTASKFNTVGNKITDVASAHLQSNVFFIDWQISH